MVQHMCYVRDTRNGTGTGGGLQPPTHVYILIKHGRIGQDKGRAGQGNDCKLTWERIDLTLEGELITPGESAEGLITDAEEDDGGKGEEEGGGGGDAP